MKPRMLAVVGYSLSAFTVVGTAVQVLALNSRLRLLAFGGTVVFAASAFLFLRRAYAYRNAVNALTSLLCRVPGDVRFRVDQICDEAQLRELWEIDNDSYGSASISFEVFHTWWRRYPCGLFALLEDQEIIGGFGIWPLCSKAFKDFVEGRIKERELCSRHIMSAKQWNRNYWYVSGIVLKTRRRKTEAIRVLIANTLQAWLDALPGAPSVNVCALAYSKEGEALLRRFGFHCYKHADETLDHFPVFARFNLSKPDLEQMFQRLLPQLARADAMKRSGTDRVIAIDSRQIGTSA